MMHLFEFRKTGWMPKVGIILAIFIVVLAVSGCGVSRKFQRLSTVTSLFDEEHIVENFRNMSDDFPYHVVEKGDRIFKFGTDYKDLPENFEYKDKTWNTEELMKDTWTTGLLVIKDDNIKFEEYYLDNNPDKLNISWSVGKSFVSALIGIAIEEGYIENIQIPVSDIVPELKKSGYDGVKLKDVLQMSSGVRFDEDYDAFFSDIHRMGRAIALGSSLNEFAAGLERERDPGTVNHYVSMDTQVLGMVLKAVTGKTPTKYLEEKIWKKIGMQADANWLTDDDGMEWVFGGLNVTVRDYARFGRLYANYGNWDGDQIVPRQWVIDSTTPSEPYLMPGATIYKLGYGYQWWIPEFPKGDFMARGVNGQYIYINPAKNVIIVKTSANPFWTMESETNDVVMAWFQYVAEGI